MAADSRRERPGEWSRSTRHVTRYPSTCPLCGTRTLLVASDYGLYCADCTDLIEIEEDFELGTDSHYTWGLTPPE